MGSDRDLHFFASLVPKLNFQRDKTRFHLVKKKRIHIQNSPSTEVIMVSELH